MDEAGTADKFDAVIVHQVPENTGPVNRMERRDLQTRHSALNHWTTVHEAVQHSIFTQYQTRTESFGNSHPLAARSIGRGILPVARVEVTRDTLPVLAEIPEILAVIPDQEMTLIEPIAVNHGRPSGMELKDGLTWGLKQLEIESIWENTRGSGVNVGVVDTGVDGTHPVLKNAISKFVYIDLAGNRIDRKYGYDTGYHGTHVCGTLAGSVSNQGIAIGVAPEGSLVVAAVPLMTISNLLEAISWAIENDAHVINMSFGVKKNYPYPHFSFLFNNIVLQYGIIPVVSIGNEGYGNSSFPGNTFSAFSVGAVSNRFKALSVAGYSSGASLFFPGHPVHPIIIKPDVVAPGDRVYSCLPSRGFIWKYYPYACLDGTSMAAPHVAGTVALLMAAHPTVSVWDIINALRLTAYHPGGGNRRPDNIWGWGLIRPLEAHKALS